MLRRLKLPSPFLMRLMVAFCYACLFLLCVLAWVANVSAGVVESPAEFKAWLFDDAVETD